MLASDLFTCWRLSPKIVMCSKLDPDWEPVNEAPDRLAHEGCYIGAERPEFWADGLRSRSMSLIGTHKFCPSPSRFTCLTRSGRQILSLAQ